MKFILILAALAAVGFFVSKKLKAKKEEAVAPKKVTPKAPAKSNTVKPAGGTSLSESDSNGDYYRKPRKAQK